MSTKRPDRPGSEVLVSASGAAEADQFLLQLRAALARMPIENWSARRVIVAFSGGLDSTLLLNALHRLNLPSKLFALHADHGLHADSAAWTEHCAAQAKALDIDFASVRVDIRREPGKSVEALAREARYAAFANYARATDVVMTAHHADDQLETVLLRMLRGTGVRGLTAIHEFSACGSADLIRPLLNFSRRAIRDQAEAWGLAWIEDPSNTDHAFDRNYLRGEVIPALTARWPAAPVLATRLARQMHEAAELLAELAASELAGIENIARLPVARLLGLSPAGQNNVLRQAVVRLGLPLPSAAQLAELRASFTSRPDAQSCVRWPGVEAHIYRDELHLMAPFTENQDCPESIVLAVDSPWRGAVGRLELVAGGGYGIPDAWAKEGLEVRFRVGGERFRPYPNMRSKSLKHWFQETGVFPWMRARVPLIYREDRLISVGDLGLAADIPQVADHGQFWQPVWTEHPPVSADERY